MDSIVPLSLSGIGHGYCVTVDPRYDKVQQQ